jgi:hypothetical protein
LTLSQYPELAQQYMQRFGGRVEALEAVVRDFDTPAASAGLSRDDALLALTGIAFGDRRSADMTRTLQRYEDLSLVYAELSAATPMQRLLLPHRPGDRETFAGTRDDFEPAIPVTMAGVVSAVAGLVAGSMLIGGLLRVMRLLLPGRR